MFLFKSLQKYWPKPNADPLNVASIENVKKKLSRYEKRPEDIKNADTNRSKKDLHIFECPPIKTDTPKSMKSTSTSKGINTKRN